MAGLVVGTIGQTGVGLQFTESVVGLSAGRLWLAILLVAIAALVLGMGLPVTAAYIVLAVMTGPALQELGLTLLTAHMMIFWLSQTSNVTPPIALAAFAGAGVAGASPMRSALAAFKLSAGLFVIPLMMAYSPLLLTHDRSWSDVVPAAGFCLLLIIAIAMLAERFLFAPLSRGWCFIVAIAGGLLVLPSVSLRLGGGGILVAVMLANWRLARRTSGLH